MKREKDAHFQEKFRDKAAKTREEGKSDQLLKYPQHQNPVTRFPTFTQDTPPPLQNRD